MLADGLKSNGHTVKQKIGDADVDIVFSVLDIACEGRDFTLVGEDTDLLPEFCICGMILWAVWQWNAKGLKNIHKSHATLVK